MKFGHLQRWEEGTSALHQETKHNSLHSEPLLDMTRKSFQQCLGRLQSMAKHFKLPNYLSMGNFHLKNVASLKLSNLNVANIKRDTFVFIYKINMTAHLDLLHGVSASIHVFTLELFICMRIKTCLCITHRSLIYAASIKSWILQYADGGRRELLSCTTRQSVSAEDERTKLPTLRTTPGHDQGMTSSIQDVFEALQIHGRHSG